MARQETILSVFVASPSDVDEERNRLEEVIRELNTAWSRELGVRLDLIRWETHAYPSFGEDAQAVINDQIPNDFDVFVGLMWYRFGTPTGRAGSGTIEEFQRAKARHDANPNDVQLMIYFKDEPAPIAPSKLDHEQLANVAKFRSGLGNEGGLYWSFQSIDDFEKLIRLHLTRQVQKWRSKNATKNEVVTVESVTSTEEFVDQEDEIGFLDLMEQFEDEFATVLEIIERIAAATVEIGNKMSARTAETQEFTVGPDAKNRKTAKRLIANAASDMDQYVHRMESELPQFSQHFNDGMAALTKAAAMSLEFNVDEDALEQAKENLEGVRSFRETMATVEGQISEFKQSVASIPRMTTVLNRSKRAMVKVIGQLENEFRVAQVMAREAEASYASIVGSD
ncbi:MAG: hypothetical protein JNK90_11965 [Planctomycetaceae bacterium]|nr:hypothetical protein [Planctomycetaceae bacterium]